MDKSQEGFFPIECQLNISGVEKSEDYKIHGHPNLNWKFDRLVAINATIGRSCAMPSS